MWEDFRVSGYSSPAYDKENKNKHQVNPTRRLPANVSFKCLFSNMKHITIILAIFILGCHPFEKVKECGTSNNSVNKNLDEKGKLDSLFLDSSLKKALSISKQNCSKDRFDFSFENKSDTGKLINLDILRSIQVDILLGYLFNPSHKHLLIRRNTSWGEYLNLYLLTNDSLVPVLTREQLSMTYVDDTIFDADGDGQKDFLVHWYPSSGCCLRDKYNVYLSLANQGTFSTDYEFINPTFSPKEKLIRGIEYGHPGEAGLYKLKWNGHKIDTIEFIYHDSKLKGTYLKTKKQFSKVGIPLKSIPYEYRKIKNLDWFMNKE